MAFLRSSWCRLSLSSFAVQYSICNSSRKERPKAQPARIPTHVASTWPLAFSNFLSQTEPCRRGVLFRFLGINGCSFSPAASFSLMFRAHLFTRCLGLGRRSEAGYRCNLFNFAICVCQKEEGIVGRWVWFTEPRIYLPGDLWHAWALWVSCFILMVWWLQKAKLKFYWLIPNNSISHWKSKIAFAHCTGARRLIFLMSLRIGNSRRILLGPTCVLVVCFLVFIYCFVEVPLWVGSSPVLSLTWDLFYSHRFAFLRDCDVRSFSTWTRKLSYLENRQELSGFARYRLEPCVGWFDKKKL